MIEGHLDEAWIFEWQGPRVVDDWEAPRTGVKRSAGSSGVWSGMGSDGNGVLDRSEGPHASIPGRH